MKKIAALFVLVLCGALLFTTTTFAAVFTVSDTDISIDIDESVWYVFTRDNLENNPELGELGLTRDYVYDVLQNEQAYIDAIMFYADSDAYVELFVRKTANDAVKQLSDYPNSWVKEFAKALAEQVDAEDYEIYQTTYKFAKMEFTDEVEAPDDLNEQNGGYAQPLSFTTESGTDYCTMYAMMYCTVVNGDTYTLMFQAEYPFIEEEYAMMDEIVDSVVFDVDPTLVDEETGFSMDWGRLGKSAIKGAVIGGASAGAAALISRKKNKGKGKREKGGKRLQKTSDQE